MTSSEIKKKLISRISQSEDKALLKSLYSLMEDESHKKNLILSDRQLAAIRSAEKQVSTGVILTDAEVKRRTSQWLGK